MSWVFKRDRGDYLHSFRAGLYGRYEELKWTPHQMFAWRFQNRNAAAAVGYESGEAGAIKKLLPSGCRKRLAEIEKQTLTMALAADFIARDASTTPSGCVEPEKGK
jgi:hypothetical protein